MAALHYSGYEKHYLAIDCILFGFDADQLKLLLIRRNIDPCKGCWSLMGGFVNKDESLDRAASRILESLTGLREVYLEQLYTYGEVNRDTDARVVSVAYYALINIIQYDEKTGEKYGAKWFPIDQIPTLIFDHREMVEKALRRLKRKTIVQPIGFELLPEKFTLTQLQKLYEAIHRERLDKRNFRKKALEMKVLTRMDEKDKHSSKRGAFLYKFDKKKYDSMVDSGEPFELK